MQPDIIPLIAVSKRKANNGTNGLWQNIRGGLMLGIACITSPCCTPLIVPAALGLLAGTPAALWLAQNAGWLYGGLTLISAVSLVMGLRWMWQKTRYTGVSKMVTTARGYALPRNALWLIAGLLAISAALFVAGVVVERSGESREVSAVQPNVSPAKSVDSDGGEGNSATGEGHSEVSEGHVDAPATAQAAPEQSESFLGINLENPWFVGAAVVVSLLLIGALWRFGYRVLPIVILFAIAAAIFDASEVLRQLQRHNTTVLLLAALVLAAHLAAALVALANLSKSRTTLIQAET